MSRVLLGLTLGALLFSTSCFSEGPRYEPHTRRYFIAADEIAWDYAPLQRDPWTGETLDVKWLTHGPDRIGRIYTKAVYRAYTDATFTKLAERPAEEAHFGIMGPLVRAVVGDEVEIVFKNNLKRGVSMHPHGMVYSADDEGTQPVSPGAVKTYHWSVPDRAGPGPMEGSSVAWMYHSHVMEPEETNAGLVGPIVVTRAERARPADGRPLDVDREIFTLYTVFNENESFYLKDNVQRAGDPASVNVDDDGFVESNLEHSINGMMFANLPGLEMKQGEHVRWYLIGMGDEPDLHTPHWHGNTVTINGMRTDVGSLLPMTMQTADMWPDNPGTWLFHCHVNDHLEGGMTALYKVLPGDGSAASGPSGGSADHDD